MSGKKAKAARRAATRDSVKTGSGTGPFLQLWKRAIVGLAVVAVLGATFVVPKLVNGTASSPASHAGMAMAAEPGTGLKVGARVPAFSEADVETGQAISSRSLASQKTLLFFSEGVMCQACFEQIKGLEQVRAELKARGISLVSIMPDSPAELRQAIAQYGIKSPMISDSDRNISHAFNTLGLGMHADLPGHAFVLIERGKVRWYHDYWLPPERSMYVEPRQLLADLAI
jgi:peroxiredoxin